ncbi:hypothetical protein LSTR_LSTR010238 [Laodelphax striatellus]|uniref:Uncharacterized protein n=1 Tax=Laodelphax striatellus TaxID=195883 RepID=A0A482WL71_LAOST|nr:hypothetical protein LSTR_LSTR010238 [Laodelphax striatellus]
MAAEPLPFRILNTTSPLLNNIGKVEPLPLRVHSATPLPKKYCMAEPAFQECTVPSSPSNNSLAWAERFRMQQQPLGPPSQRDIARREPLLPGSQAPPPPSSQQYCIGMDAPLPPRHGIPVKIFDVTLFYILIIDNKLTPKLEQAIMICHQRTAAPSRVAREFARAEPCLPKEDASAPSPPPINILQGPHLLPRNATAPPLPP